MKSFTLKINFFKKFLFFLFFLVVTLTFFGKVYAQGCQPGGCAGCEADCQAQRPGGKYGADCCNPALNCASCNFCASRGACMSLPNSSLEQFQKTVQQAERTGQTNLQWYFGSDNGTIEATTNALTGLIVGTDIDWDQLHAGNFQNARIGGAFGFTTNLIAQVLTQPPVSSREYFADLGKNFGIAKPAYAQGIGFKGLQNLLPLWKASRNLAYILFVIIFLATGLAIMFRVKLDPKTVITIQNAIPKLIITLILVTFSYAIVGLMIDLIYVLIYLGVLAIGQTGWLGDAAKIAQEQAKFANLSLGGGLGLIFGGGVQAVWLGIVSIGLLAIVGVLFGIVAPVIGVGVAAFPLLLLSIIALYCIFKLLLSLLSCYLSIIISLIIGPLQIAFGVLPGNQSGFGEWFKNLLANILVFPTVALAMLLGWLLTRAHGPDWTPPVLGVSGGGLSVLLGFAMLLLLPKIPDMVKAAFKMKPAGYGAAIGEALGAPGKAFMTVGTVAKVGTQIGSAWRTRFGTKEAQTPPTGAPSRPG